MSTREDEAKAAAGRILTHLAGYIGLHTMDIGLRYGLFHAIEQSGGATASQLARLKNLDPFRTEVWCRGAYAAEVLDVKNPPASATFSCSALAPHDEDIADLPEAKVEVVYTMAPHMAELLLNEDSPGWLGGLPKYFVRPEVFDQFKQKMGESKQVWWDMCSLDYIAAACACGTSAYTRMATSGFAKVPGLDEILNRGGKLADLGAGLGGGLIRLARRYPEAGFVGVEGTAYEVKEAEANVRKAGLEHRISFVCAMLEDSWAQDEYDALLILNTIHELRDKDKVMTNVLRALKPNGIFVISDFPTPETIEDNRTVAGRIMRGIQFYESMMGVQHRSMSLWERLMRKHGFADVGTFLMTGVHGVVHGRKPSEHGTVSVGTAQDPRLLGQLMITAGTLAPERLNAALEEQKSTGELLGQVLVRRGYATKQQVLRAVADQLGIDHKI